MKGLHRAAGTMLLGALALATFPRGARAQVHAPNGPLPLPEALQEALQHRPLIASDADRVAAARARVTQARAPLLPHLDIQGSATDGPLGAPALGLGGLAGTPIKKHTGGSLNLVQTLLDFGRAENTSRARQDEVTGSLEGMQADRNRVALDVTQAYLGALEARRLLEVNRQILQQRQLVAQQAGVLQQNGLASRVDVDLAELNVSQSRLAVLRAQDDIETAFAALSAAIGRPVPSDTPLVDTAPPEAPPTAPPPAGSAPSPATPPGPEPLPPAAVGQVPALEPSVTDALRNRPELRQARAQVRAAEHLTAAAGAGRYPLVTGVGSVGKVNPVPLFQSSDKPWAVGIAVTIPIFTGELVEGQVEEQRQNASAARENLAEMTNAIRQQVTGAEANLAASEQSLEVARAEVTRAEDALNLATQRYQARLGSIVELGQAQVAFATAQNDFVRAEYDRELARAALAYATGQSPPGTPNAGGSP